MTKEKQTKKQTDATEPKPQITRFRSQSELDKELVCKRLIPDRKRLENAKTLKDVIEVLKGIQKFWMEREMLTDILADKPADNVANAMMWFIRYTLVDYKSEYPFLPNAPVDWLGLQEWIIDAERVLDKVAIEKSKKQTKKRKRILESNRTYKLGDYTVILPDATSFNPIKACQPLSELVRAEWPSGDNSTLVKDCLGIVDELLQGFIMSHFNSRDQRHSEFVYSQLRRWLVELRKKSNVELPPIPSDILGVEDWIIDVERALVKAAEEASKQKKEPEQPTQPSGGKAGETKEPTPAPAIEKAYQSYQYAIEKNPDFAGKKDKEVYTWLKNSGIDDYTLPAFETWQRYVRKGRKHCGTSKNTPRAGRAGRSIITLQ